MLDVAAWARDVINVLVGVAAGATKASAASPVRASCPLLDPSTYESQAAFKRAVAQAAWAERHRAFQRFSDLRAQNPGLAERFPSECSRSRNALQIALVDQIDGRPLDAEESLTVLQSDLTDRVHNDFPFDPAEQHAQARAVSAVRSMG